MKFQELFVGPGVNSRSMNRMSKSGMIQFIPSAAKHVRVFSSRRAEVKGSIIQVWETRSKDNSFAFVTLTILLEEPTHKVVKVRLFNTRPTRNREMLDYLGADVTGLSLIASYVDKKSNHIVYIADCVSTRVGPTERGRLFGVDTKTSSNLRSFEKREESLVESKTSRGTVENLLELVPDMESLKRTDFDFASLFRVTFERSE